MESRDRAAARFWGRLVTGLALFAVGVSLAFSRFWIGVALVVVGGAAVFVTVLLDRERPPD